VLEQLTLEQRLALLVLGQRTLGQLALLVPKQEPLGLILAQQVLKLLGMVPL